jgi:hypothetical protein
MSSNAYTKKLAKRSKPVTVADNDNMRFRGAGEIGVTGRRAGKAKPVIAPDNTLQLHGSAKIFLGKEEHPVRYELLTSLHCGLVPSTLSLYGPEKVLRDASRDLVVLEIDGARFKTPVIPITAPGVLDVDALPLFRLIIRAMRFW